MREFLLSVASPEFLSWFGFVLLVAGLLGEVAILVEPFESHRSHKLLGFAFAAIVLIGYLIGHIGDDAITARFERRATIADDKVAELDRLRAPRHLSDAEKARMTADLAGQPVGQLVIKASVAAGDARAY